MKHSDIVRILRDYGPVEGDFIASRLGMSMTETRPYLDALETAGVIERRGHVVMLAGETRSSSSASTPHR
jgi:predicted ArsR family transcriptional regulator